MSPIDLDDEISTISADDATVPVMNPGHRKFPMDWNELVDIIAVQKDHKKLVRSREQLRNYELFWKDELAEWSSITDYVLCQRFSKIFTRQRDVADERYKAYPSLQDVVKSGQTYFAVVRNDFPYHMAPGIEHWILWKVGGNICSEEEIQRAKSMLATRLGEDMLHWVNPPFYKALPEIDHIHVIGKVLKAESNVSMEEFD